jgi:hypothetical protein
MRPGELALCMKQHVEIDMPTEFAKFGVGVFPRAGYVPSGDQERRAPLDTSPRINGMPYVLETQTLSGILWELDVLWELEMLARTRFFDVEPGTGSTAIRQSNRDARATGHRAEPSEEQTSNISGP